MPRNAEDYGLYDLSDQELEYLANLPKSAGGGGEKNKLAARELASRRAMLRDADIYRQALQKSTLANLGPAYTQGLDSVTNRLAGMGPLADSGARNAMNMQLYSRILQQAQGQQAAGMSDYISSFLKGKQNYRYQSMLQKQQEKANKKKWYDYAAGIGGAAVGALAGGPAGAAVGYGMGSQATDAYYG